MHTQTIKMPVKTLSSATAVGIDNNIKLALWPWCMLRYVQPYGAWRPSHSP